MNFGLKIWETTNNSVSKDALSRCENIIFAGFIVFLCVIKDIMKLKERAG